MFISQINHVFQYNEKDLDLKSFQNSSSPSPSPFEILEYKSSKKRTLSPFSGVQVQVQQYPATKGPKFNKLLIYRTLSGLIQPLKPLSLLNIISAPASDLQNLKVSALQVKTSNFYAEKSTPNQNLPIFQSNFAKLETFDKGGLRGAG